MIENPIALLIIYNGIIITIIYGRKNLKKALYFFIPAFITTSIIFYEYLTFKEKFFYWFIISTITIFLTITITKFKMSENF